MPENSAAPQGTQESLGLLWPLWSLGKVARILGSILRKGKVDHTWWMRLPGKAICFLGKGEAFIIEEWSDFLNLS